MTQSTANSIDSWNAIFQLIQSSNDAKYKTLQFWVNKLSVNKVIGEEIYLHSSDTYTANYFLQYCKKDFLNFAKDSKLNITNVYVNTKEAQGALEISKEPNVSYDYSRRYGLRLNKKFTFDNFIVDKSNVLAYNSALKAAESGIANDNINPLFIYGNIGVGKTHLLQSIANKIDAKHKCLYISAESFTNSFTQSIRNKSILSFKKFMRSLDYLIIDDFHFLAGKAQTQMEFFHTFEELVSNNKQIIIAANKSPGELEDIYPNILSRISYGFIANIDYADYDLRHKIILNSAKEQKINIPEDVASFLASNINGDIRAIKGAVNKLSSMIDMNYISNVDMNVMRNHYSDFVKSKARNVTTQGIISGVSSFYNVSEAEIISSQRGTRLVSQARHLAIYMSHVYTPDTIKKIADTVGKRKHCTALNSIKSIKQQIDDDPSLSNTIEVILNKIYNRVN